MIEKITRALLSLPHSYAIIFTEDDEFKSKGPTPYSISFFISKGSPLFEAEYFNSRRASRAVESARNPSGSTSRTGAVPTRRASPTDHRRLGSAGFETNGIDQDSKPILRIYLRRFMNEANPSEFEVRSS